MGKQGLTQHFALWLCAGVFPGRKEGNGRDNLGSRERAPPNPPHTHLSQLALVSEVVLEKQSLPGPLHNPLKLGGTIKPMYDFHPTIPC